MKNTLYSENSRFLRRNKCCFFIFNFILFLLYYVFFADVFLFLLRLLVCFLVIVFLFYFLFCFSLVFSFANLIPVGTRRGRPECGMRVSCCWWRLTCPASPYTGNNGGCLVKYSSVNCTPGYTSLKSV